MISDIYELSPMQRAMLFHAAHSPQSAAHFNQFSCKINGPLRPDLFQRAWQKLVKRHAVLRTSFHWEGLDKPLQVVHDEAALPWTYQDWRALEPETTAARWQEHLLAERGAGFALDSAPLMRCTLVRIAESEYLFDWSHHHIIMDGWCLSLVLEEFFKVYEALASPKTLDLPPTDSYRTYIEWLQRQDIDKARNYWTDYLKGFRAATELPTAWEKVPVRPDANQLLQCKLPEWLGRSLRQTASTHRITPNTLIQGAWALLLSRYSGESDVVFGATVAGRPTDLPGAGGMLGLFINTVPVRVQVDYQATLVDWLRLLQARQADRGCYEYAPLSDIQQWSEVPRGTRLFDSNVIFMNYPLNESLTRGDGGLLISETQILDQTDMLLQLQVTPGVEWTVELAYDVEVISADTASRLLSHLHALLRSFAADPSRPLSLLPLLPPGERLLLLSRFNPAPTPFDPSLNLVRRLELLAAADPFAPAVSCAGRSRSRRRLNASANRLARRLLRLRPHLGSDRLVALLCHRSERMVEAILAVWKCGAAYLPLDPSDPPARLRSLLADSRAELIITEPGLLPDALLAAPDAPAVVYLDTDDDTSPAQDDDTDLLRQTSPSDLAYVIYTSGSTGAPKGVMVEHAGMLNHLLAKVEDLRLGPTSVVAQTASHCFDISVWQCFAAPLAGGRTVVYPDEVVREPGRLLAGADSDGVTVMEVVPSYLGVLLERAGERPGLPAGLEQMVVTGEALSPSLARGWFTASGVPLVNAYGPTEASDDITHHVMRSAPEGVMVAAGRPVRNLRVYVVDGRMEVCPVGVRGEVCVAGVGVGRGYLGEAGRTAEAFVPDAFGEERGGRMYRTGDVGSWSERGELVLHGRRDQQVKVRGHRIELQEIEVFLERHPEVAGAVVLLQEDRNRGKRLVAYVVPVAGKTPTADSMRKFLLTQVPDYMIPAAYCLLESFPLSRQGKIDRKALREPEPSAEAEGRIYVAPRNIAESKLVEIWEEVLSRPRVGVTDDYFDLGGHSILAVSLMAKIEKEFGKRIPLAQLFKNPTVAQLATALRGESVESQWEELVEIRRSGSKPPLFLMPGAGGNVIYFHPLANRLSAEVPVYALQAIGLDGVTPPLTRVEDIALRNVRAIRNVSPDGPYYLVGHSFGGLVAFEMSQILRRQGLPVGMLAILDTPAPVFTQDPYYSGWDNAQWLMAVASEIGTFLASPIAVSYEELAGLDPEAQLTRLAEKIGAKGPWAAGTDSTRLRAYLNVYKANFKTNYQPPQEVFPVPVSLFKSSESRPEEIVPTPEMEVLKQDPAWGWGSFSSELVNVVTVPGTHLSMLLEPHVAVLAEKLEQHGWKENDVS